MPRSGDPDGVIRVAVELTVRWASALPVRRAMALVEFGRDRLDHPVAMERLLAQPDFVIELSGLPYRLVNEDFERGLEKASLIVRGHRALLPLSVEVASVGSHALATLRFTRIAGLSRDSGNIELQMQAGTLRIEQSFKLRQMIYQRALEL